MTIILFLFILYFDYFFLYRLLHDFKRSFLFLVPEDAGIANVYLFVFLVIAISSWGIKTLIMLKLTICALKFTTITIRFTLYFSWKY